MVQNHHLQEPVTGLLYAALPDGTHGLVPTTDKAVAFQTSERAIEYATTRLAGLSAEIVRVTS